MRVMRRFLIPLALLAIAAVAVAALVVGLQAGNSATDPGPGRALDSLKAEIATQTKDLTALRATVTEQDKRIAAQQKRLGVICDDKGVATTRASILGQQSAYDSPDYNYFGNLQSVIDAACGSEYAEPVD